MHVFCVSADRTVARVSTSSLSAILTSAGQGTLLVGLGDVNNDGFGDVAAGDKNSAGFSVIYGRGPGPLANFLAGSST